MSDVVKWKIDPDINSDSPPDGFPEGMTYSNVNNSAREVMAAIARWNRDISGQLTTQGTPDALIISTEGITRP